MQSSAVFELQGYLRSISRINGDILSIVPDGIFGKETTTAVKGFQKSLSLNETGIVDYDLWEKIKKEATRSDYLLSEPINIVKIENSDLPLKRGDKNVLIYTLHLMLNKLAGSFINFDSLPIDDTFTHKTQMQVLLWQKIIAHDETGQVDKITWDSLVAIYLL